MKRILIWKYIRWAVFGLAAVFVVIQFVPVARSNPAVAAEVLAPPAARAVLRRACYDCHSNETVWPWYSKVAPVSWLVARDVAKGRDELNFSTWEQYTSKRQDKKLQEILEEITEGEMPPWFYLSVHRDAVLSAEDTAVLRSWVLAMQH